MLNRVPKPGCKSFTISVLPSRDCLATAIGQNGFCHPRKCWHFVAISAIMTRLDPDGKHHRVKIDAGHVKLNYKGWRYIADTPLHVKRSLMLFDDQKYDQVLIRRYNLKFRRTTKIVPITAERAEQIRSLYHQKVASGYVPKKVNLRARVAGFSGIV
jgi:hypothetical protein